MRVSLLHQVWKVYVLEEEKFIRRFGENIEGVTILEDKKVYLNMALYNEETISHELFHCYMYAMCVNAACLTKAQLEEVSAEIMARYGRQLLKQSKHLAKNLRKD